MWYGTEGLSELHYGGRVIFRTAGEPSESALTITGPGGEILAAQSCPLMDPAKDYRLRFSAVGERLELRLFDLAEPERAMATCTATDDRIPVGMIALYGTKSSGNNYDVTVEHFVFNGTARSIPGVAAR